MARFSVSAVAGEDQLGHVLRAAREEKRLTPTEVSRRLKLPIKYLEALESGRWHELPEGSYARLFVRTYAKYLGLPTEELLRKYPVPIRVSLTPNHHPTSVRRVAYGRRILVVIGSLAIVLYLASQAWQAFQPTQLSLLSPLDAVTTFTPSALVAGVTKVGTVVTVNGEVVEVSGEGRFSLSLALSPGINTITVVARKAHSDPLTIVRRVLYTAPASPSTDSKSLLP